MRILILQIGLLLFCTTQCISQGTSKDLKSTNEKEKFYTLLDTVVIITQNLDTLSFTKTEFNQIIDNLPSLYNDDLTLQPDINYKCSTMKRSSFDKEGNLAWEFTSEAGQDAYYILYAYFLKQRNGENAFSVRRTTLNNVYNLINCIFSSINNGGTFFSHQYKRIIAYTEFSIYLYSQNKDYYSNVHDIQAQKKIYLHLLRQIIKDELSEDGGTIGTERQKKEKKIYSMVDRLGKLITDNFYLKSAQAFQFSYY